MQADVAKALNMTVRSYQRFELGERLPRVPTAVEIATMYGVTVDWIFHGTAPGVPARLYEDIGKTLKRLRGKGPQRKVAEAVGITLRAYQDFESGKRLPRLPILVKIAEIHDVTVYRILENVEFGSPSFEALCSTYMAEMVRELDCSVEKGTATKEERDFRWRMQLWQSNYELKLQEKNEKEEANRQLEAMKEWLDEFWEKASEDEKIWLLIHFKKSFSEYEGWLKEREDTAAKITRS